ncbi:MAG TPA: hypothetical protein VL358_04670 [Caulobacteraceae bacterium]|jgi:hypothetical protein|nr:hypothetical protein [Caulobacteraceae bacterium]
MIAADSKSYPVTGAALAAGVDPGIACRYNWQLRLIARDGVPAVLPLFAIWREGCRRFGEPRMRDLVERLGAARAEGRIYAPELGGK